MNRVTLFVLLVIAPGLAICLALLGLETARTNLLGWILLGLGVAYSGGILIDYHVRREMYRGPAKGSRGAVDERGDLSFWLLLPGFLAVFFAPPLEWMHLAPTLPRATALETAGCALFVAGLALIVWARQSLRSSYSTHLAVYDGRPLVDDGPYRVVRHPAYGGLLLMGLGVAIGYASTIGLAAIAILLMPAWAYRIRVQERLLAIRYGQAYAAYARRTRCLIPGLW
jgi:protein-S-isoprenylcysteine O-methyltransferase Ste14